MKDPSQRRIKHLSDSRATSPVRPESLLVTRPEAARILSLSLREIDKLRAAGGLMAKKHGSKVLFPMAELERYAESLPWEDDLHD